MTLGEQVWRSGESARLPPMWRFDSRTQCHKWAEFVCSLLCSESTPVFPSPQKPTFDLIWFRLIYVDFQSPQLAEHLCSARKIWDLNKVVIEWCIWKKSYVKSCYYYLLIIVIPPKKWFNFNFNFIKRSDSRCNMLKLFTTATLVIFYN